MVNLLATPSTDNPDSEMSWAKGGSFIRESGCNVSSTLDTSNQNPDYLVSLDMIANYV